MLGEPITTSSAIKLAAKFLPSVYRALAAWREKANKTTQEEIWEVIRRHQAAKEQQQRIEESISKTLQTMRLKPEALDALRLLDSDPVLSQEIGTALSQGALDPPALAEIMRKNLDGAASIGMEMNSIAGVWLDAIRLTIGESPSLSHALQFQSLERIETGLITLEDATQTLQSQNERLLKQQDLNTAKTLEVLTQQSALLHAIYASTKKDNDDANSNEARTVIGRQFSSRFEKCRNKLIEGSIIDAEGEFAQLISDLVDAGKLADQDILFKCHLNHSSCLLMQGRVSEASNALDRARQLSPADNRLRRHESILLCYQGRLEEALVIVQELRLVEPNEVKHITNEIAILQDLNRNEELCELIKTASFDGDDFLCQKAHALLHLNRLDEAEAVANQAIKLKPESEGAWIALAYIKGFPIARKSDDGTSFIAAPNKEQYESLSVAIEAAQKAHAILQKRERSQLRDDLQTNLLAFYAIAHRDEDALKLAASISVAPSLCEVALENMYCLFCRNNLGDKALEVANALIEKRQTSEALLKKANALLMVGKPELALQLLLPLKDADQSIVTIPRWHSLIARTYYSLHQIDEAIAHLQGALTVLPDSQEVHLGLAEIMSESGDAVNAETHFQRAARLAPSDLQVAANYGLFLYDSQRWGDALIHFERFGAHSPLSPLFPKFLVCLYNSGQNDLCSDLSQKWLSTKRKPNETVFAIGARAAYHSNNLQVAKLFLEELVRLGGTQHVAHRKMLGQVYLRLDDLPQAYTLLTQVVSENPSDSSAQTLLGQICSARGKHQEALRHHLKAIELRPTDIYARSAFFGSMLTLPEGTVPSEDCMRIHHENISILASHPSGVLRTIRVARDDGELDFSEIRKELEIKEKAVDEALRFCEENPMPIAIFARNLGCSIFSAWDTLTRDQQRGVRICNGSMDEQTGQLAAANQASAVSVDLIALFTLQKLGCLGLLSKFFGKIVVHISILDEVVKELRTRRDFPSSGSIASVKGKLFMTEVDLLDAQTKLASLTSIRDFVKSPEVDLVGLKAGTKYPNIAGQEVGEAIQALMAPALAATEHNAALLSDDQVFRLFATPLTIPSFSTQAFLRAAKESALLSPVEYDDAVLSLHAWNYHFVSHNSQTLIRLFQKTGGAPDDLAKRIFNMVGRPGYATQSSRRVLADFFAYLWSKAPRYPENLFHEWATSLWLAVISADRKLKFALGFIADLAALLWEHPFAFGMMMAWLVERGPGAFSVKKRLIRSAMAAASAFSSNNSALVQHPELHRKWQRQLKAFEMFEIMWSASSK